MPLAHVETTGSMPGGEAFSFGWWEATTEDTAQESAEAIKALGVYQNILISTGTLNGPGVAFQTLYVRTYSPQGGPATDAGQVGLADVDVNYQAAAYCPNQTALCVTLRSAAPGGSGRNRFYLPITAPGGLTGGKIAAASAQLIANRVYTYAQSRPVVCYSGKLKASHALVKVTCGDVPDSQNGRRRGLKEDMYSGTVVGP